MIILGIDPGTAATGYGVIRGLNDIRKIKCLDYGCITTKASSSPGKRLEKTADGLAFLIKKYRPAALAVERIYFFKNLKTAMPVSQAKGVVLLIAAQKNIPVYEFTPPQVKMTITGYGRAEKKQVQKMIQTILGLEAIPKPDDAADALAIALCGFYNLVFDKKRG